MKKNAVIGSLFFVALGFFLMLSKSCASPESKINRQLDKLESVVSYFDNSSNIKKMAALQSLLGLMSVDVEINISAGRGESIKTTGKDSIRDIYLVGRSRAEELHVKFKLREIEIVSETQAVSTTKAMVQANASSDQLEFIKMRFGWVLKDGSWIIQSVEGKSELQNSLW